MALQYDQHQSVDRTKTTPFLLRLFYRQNVFHSPSEFTTVPITQTLAQSSLQLYTWPDATLSELTSLVASAMPDLLPNPSVGTRIGYRLLYPDTRSISGPGADEGRGRWLSKELGSVVVGEDLPDDHEMDGEDDHAAPTALRKLGGDADKTLADARFVIGDYVSCAIVPPRSDGSVAPLPTSERSSVTRGYGRGGANGFGNGYGSRFGRDGHGRDGYGRGYENDRAGGTSNVPSGDWRRGEAVPDGPRYGDGRASGRYH